MHKKCAQHSLGLQQNCLEAYDSLNFLSDAALSSKNWSSTLQASEVRFRRSSKQIGFRAKEIASSVEACSHELTTSKLLGKLQQNLAELCSDLNKILPGFDKLLNEVTEAGEAELYYFEAYKELKEQKEQSKQQRRVSNCFRQASILKLLVLCCVLPLQTELEPTDTVQCMWGKNSWSCVFLF